MCNAWCIQSNGKLWNSIWKNVPDNAKWSNDIVKQAVDKNEPSIISRYLIDVAKLYSSFYNDNKIIVEDEKIKNTRLCLTYMVGNVLKIGTGLLGMEMPDRM